MECKFCRGYILDGEAFRAEPIAPGSRHHVAYHIGCYTRLKAERQKQKEKAFPDYPDRGSN